jgi:hypothetical protein
MAAVLLAQTLSEENRLRRIVGQRLPTVCKQLDRAVSLPASGTLLATVR